MNIMMKVWKGVMSDGGEDEIAEQARRLAKEQAFSPERFVAILERGAYTSVDSPNLPAAEREIVLPMLRALLRERGGVVQLNVARALLELGDPLGSEVLAECLASGSHELRDTALYALTFFPHNPQTGGYAVPIDPDAILAALEPTLADARSFTRERAVNVLHRLATPRATDRLAELLADVRPDVRAHAAIALGRADKDRGALAVIDEMLRLPAHPNRYHLIVALEHLCESGDAEMRARASAVAARFVRANLKSGNEIANHVHNCLRAIAKAGLPDEADLLQEVLGLRR